MSRTPVPETDLPDVAGRRKSMPVGRFRGPRRLNDTSCTCAHTWTVSDDRQRCVNRGACGVTGRARRGTRRRARWAGYGGLVGAVIESVGAGGAGDARAACPNEQSGSKCFCMVVHDGLHPPATVRDGGMTEVVPLDEFRPWQDSAKCRSQPSIAHVRYIARNAVRCAGRQASGASTSSGIPSPPNRTGIRWVSQAWRRAVSTGTGVPSEYSPRCRRTPLGERTRDLGPYLLVGRERYCVGHGFRHHAASSHAVAQRRSSRDSRRVLRTVASQRCGSRSSRPRCCTSSRSRCWRSPTSGGRSCCCGWPPVSPSPGSSCSATTRRTARCSGPVGPTAWSPSSCMVPSAHVEAAWNLGHNRIHHGYTTREGFDFVWHPITVDDYRAMGKLARLRHRLEWSFARLRRLLPPRRLVGEDVALRRDRQAGTGDPTRPSGSSAQCSRVALIATASRRCAPGWLDRRDLAPDQADRRPVPDLRPDHRLDRVRPPRVARHPVVEAPRMVAVQGADGVDDDPAVPVAHQPAVVPQHLRARPAPRRRPDPVPPAPGGGDARSSRPIPTR